MGNDINIKQLVGGLARRNYANRTGGLEFRNKVKEALEGSGFGKVKAARIATGIKSGNLNLTRDQSLKVIKALREGKLIKSSVGSVRGAMGTYLNSQNKGVDTEEVKKKRIEILNRLRQREESNRPDIDEILGHKVKEAVPEAKTMPVGNQFRDSLVQEAEDQDLPLD